MIVTQQHLQPFQHFNQNRTQPKISFSPYRTQTFKTKTYKESDKLIVSRNIYRNEFQHKSNDKSRVQNIFHRQERVMNIPLSSIPLLKLKINKNQKQQDKKSQIFRNTFCISKPAISSERSEIERPPTSQIQTYRPSTRIRKISNIGEESNNNFLAKYQIIKQLGKGTYGTVYLAKKKIKNTFCRISVEKIQDLVLENKSQLMANRTQNAQQQIQKESKSGRQTIHVSQNLQFLQPLNFQKSSVQLPESLGSQSDPEQQLFAIKVYEKFKMNKDPAKFKNIRKEITVMQNLDHEGVIKLYESVESLTKISLVVEYGGELSLLDFLKKNFPLSQNMLKNFAKQLINTINYLHDKNIVHRDIKPQNILVKDNPLNPESFTLKLIDFGFSTLTNKSRKLNAICGTPNFMAPQLLSSKEYFGEKADIWAYGVVIFVLAEGRHPFKSSQYQELERLVNKGKYIFKRKQTSQFEDFIYRILRVNSFQRPTALQISKFKWLNQQ